MNAPGAVLLVSPYELGHQSFTLGSAWARLEHAGFGVAALDASVDAPRDELFRAARLVAVSVPMHTALRLGSELAARVREVNPSAHVCLFGLYAWMNAAHLLSGVADSVIGGEFENSLVDLARALERGAPPDDVRGLTTRAHFEKTGVARPAVRERIEFLVPERRGLPELSRYARLIGPERGQTRVTGYTEASRGCKYRCRHCPVVPVYDGRFFVVPEDVVLADVAAQVAAGARHVTFGDPDFLNGPKHALRVARRLHAAQPELTFDVTVKIEHVLKHRALFPELARLGCLFGVSAVESLSDRVLAELDKGHTRADVLEALAILRAAGIALRPSLVPFTPWATLDDYVELIDFVFEEDLVEHVDPIQLAIRLLIPPGSALLWPRASRHVERDATPAAPDRQPPQWLGALDPAELSYAWSHPDPRMDALYADVSAAVERGAASEVPDAEQLAEIRALAYAAAGRAAPPLAARASTRFVPRLSEAWFCCAEPSRAQRERIAGAACGSACLSPDRRP
jgi:radical SAM superfamily enzyme YgiQ (UPF0313 family)